MPIFFPPIQVRDGPSHVSPLIGRYCGNVLPPAVTSSDSVIWIRFHSDSTTARSGFNARVQAVETPCGFRPLVNATEEAQVLKSPNYPNPYPSNLHCRWIIQLPDQRGLDVSIQDLDLAASPRCRQETYEILLMCFLQVMVPSTFFQYASERCNSVQF